MAIKFLNSVNADSGVLYVDAANDRVGIGTTSPTEKLAVDGNIETTAAAGKIGFNVGDAYGDFPHYGLGKSNGANPVNLAGYYGLTFGSNGAERMRITSAGNVGIGTTSPNAKLDVNNSAVGEYAYFGSGSTRQLRLSSYNTVSDHAGHKINASSGNGEITLATNSIAALTVKNDQTIQLNAYGAGYLKSDASGNITVDTSTIEDTLQSVTDRGATTSNTIEFTGAANAYVGIQGETDVNLKIGTGAGSEPRMYLFGSANGQTNAGNIFIGTADNTGMVDINGDVDISGFAGFNGITAPDFPVDISSVDGGKVLRSTRGTSIFRIDQSNDGPGYIGMQSADDLSIQTNNTSKMYITSDGKVGIGTTSPSAKLHVNGQLGVGDLALDGVKVSVNQATSFPGSNTSNTRIIDFIGSNAGSNTEIGAIRWLSTDGDNGNYQYHAAGITSHNSGASNDGDLRFFVTSNATATPGVGTIEALRITEVGNVGIGTNSPNQKLEVAGRVRATTDPTFEAYNTSANRGGFQWVDGSLMTKIFSGGSSGAGAGIILETNTTEKMRITSAGNVGIGTTSPARELHVKGNNGWGEVRIEGQTFASGHGASLEFYSEGTALADIYASTDKHLYFRTNGGTERMRITSGGAVLVNKTSSTGDIFQVQGSNNVYASRFDGSTTVGQSYGLRVRAGTNASDKSFLIENTSGTDLVVVKGDGNLQLGAYGAGYLKSDASGNITVDSDTIEDTLDSVTGRGATTSNNISVGTLTASGGGNTVVLKKGTGNPAVAFAGTSDEASALLEGISGGGLKLYTSNGGTLTTPAWSAKMTVTAGGNVGIGTTSPRSGYKLTLDKGTNVAGEFVGISIEEAGGTGYGYIRAEDQLTPDTSFVIGHTSRVLTLETQDTERVRIDNSGNVGIGTSNPQSKLHVAKAGNSNGGSMIIGPTGSGTAKWSYLAGTHYNQDTGSGNGSGSAGMAIIGSLSASTYNRVYVGGGPYEINPATEILFFTHTATTHNLGGSQRMVINSSGNVGIGTTSPDFTLDVEKDVDTWVSRIYNTGSDANAQALLIRSDATAAHDATVLGVYADSGYKMVVKSTGNVGIGTASPTRKLHVVGGSTYAALLDSDQDYTLGLARSGTEEWWLKTYTDGRFAIHENGVGDKVTIKAGGNVGIGTTNPGSILHIQGDGSGILELTRNSGTPHIFFKNTANTGYGRIYISDDLFQISAGTSTKALDFAWIQGDSNGNIAFPQYGAGYLKSDASGNITVDADIIEDTLDSVTDRGATTTNSISVGTITLTDDPASSNGTFVKVYEDTHKRMYTANLDFSFTAAGTYNFNLVFANSGGYQYELTAVNSRNGLYRNFGTLKDSSYIYWESDEDFTHRAEGDLHMISSYSNGMYFSADTTYFLSDGVTDTEQTGTANWSYAIVRYSVYIPYYAGNSTGTWKLHLTTYGDTGSSTPQFVLA